MDLQFTQEELDFQSEVREWLKENYSEDMRKRYGNSPNGHLTREDHMQWQQLLYRTFLPRDELSLYGHL